MQADIKKILKKEVARIYSREKGGISPVDTFTVESLRGDGSSRQFYRVFCGAESYIAIYAPVDDLSVVTENDSYVYIGKHLRTKGIPVPEIYAYSMEKGIIIVEDLGDHHLQSVIDFENSYEEGKAWYLKILEALIKMQVDGSRDFDGSRCFDTPVYDKEFIFRRELLYFKREFLERHLGLSAMKPELDNELRELAEAVSQIPNNFFMHRDFQSRNIMVKNSRFYFIDFQAGRFGPPTYDLASLLIDPYVGMPKTLQEELMHTYFREAQKYLGMSHAEFEKNYRLTALCRNFQILAAFVYLSKVKQKSFFEQYINPALVELASNLRRIDQAGFKILGAIIQSEAQKIRGNSV